MLPEQCLTHTMTFTCAHVSKKHYTPIILEGVKADKWFKMCGECGLKVNWSPKLKAWMSEHDWTEYRNFGRKAAGLDSE